MMKRIHDGLIEDVNRRLRIQASYSVLKKCDEVRDCGLGYAAEMLAYVSII
jgi:hypothetical protein